MFWAHVGVKKYEEILKCLVHDWRIKNEISIVQRLLVVICVCKHNIVIFSRHL